MDDRGKCAWCGAKVQVIRSHFVNHDDREGNECTGGGKHYLSTPADTSTKNGTGRRDFHVVKVQGTKELVISSKDSFEEAKSTAQSLLDSTHKGSGYLIRNQGLVVWGPFIRR